MTLGGDSKIWLAVAVVFLLNFIIGLLLINEGIFHHDGIALAQAVEATYRDGYLHPAVNGRYGAVIINAVLYLPFFLSGSNADFVTRFSSVLFHSLSVVACLFLIWELFGDHVQAIFGALLLSFVPFYFSPNTFGKEHGMGLCFLLLSFFFLARGVRRNLLPLVVVSSLCFALAVSARESILVVFPLLVLFFLSPSISLRPLKVSVPPDRLDLKLLLSFFLPFALVLAVMLYTYLGPVLYKTLFIKDTPVVRFLGLFSVKLQIALVNLFQSLPAVLFLFIFFGAYWMARKGKGSLAFFLLLWALSIFCYANVSIYKPRFLDVVVIPLFIFASYGLSCLYARYKVAAVTIVAYAVLSMFLFSYPMLHFRHHYNGEKQLALFVKDMTENNAIIITSDDLPFIEYYGHRAVEPLPVGALNLMGRFVERVKGYLMKNTPVYFTESPYYEDYGMLARMLVAEHFGLIAVGEVFTENYHNPELGFRTCYQKLYRVSLKKVP